MPLLPSRTDTWQVNSLKVIGIAAMAFIIIDMTRFLSKKEVAR